MAQLTVEDSSHTVLDRTVDLSRVGWSTIGAAVIVLLAIGLRFAQLDETALTPAEARRAYQAYSFFRGSTAGPGQALPDTAPAFLLLQSLSFFLFGATDVTARAMSALLGVGLVGLTLMLRPFVGRPATIGMAALTAVSPTLLFASRTADPQIAVAFFTLLLVVAILRIGLPGTTAEARRWWALVAGFALAAGFASSSVWLTVLISVLVGVAVALATENGLDGVWRRSLVAFIQTPHALLCLIAGFVVTTIVLFSRLFSSLSALGGIGGTVGDWGRLLATAASTTPTQFFLLSLLLYELLAVAFAIIAANRGRTGQASQLTWPFFAGWFAAALLIFSFSAGRAPEHTVHLALPLVLLGGMGLASVVDAIDLRNAVRSRAVTLLVILIGLVVAAIAWGVMIGRISGAPDQTQALFQVAAVGILAVFPFAFAAVVLIRSDLASGRGRQAGLIALSALAIFLVAYTVRSSIMLSFYNADSGIELLAQRTSTPAVSGLVTRLHKLSRDATVTQASPRDPTGGHGLAIAIDRRVQWPYRWYFRDYPDASVVAPGQAPQSGAHVVIAPDSIGMAEAGYTPRDYPTINRVPAAYAAPSIGDVLKGILFPGRWGAGVEFLILRELTTKAPPETVAVGLNAELANRLFPNTGPFSLLERAGAGSGRGQFNGPRGIAVAPDDGTVYVVDMGNARVQRFDELGDFVGIWGGEAGGVTFERTAAGLGPTGIRISPDGQLVYVCDTWNHRIVVLDRAGRLVREFGSFRDILDSPDPTIDTGFFFGPRDVAVTAEEIYVVDTGNERIQVFGLDGTFRRAWGGYGSGPGQLIEPVGIALGDDGRVYVADSGNARISVFAADGTPLDQWSVEAWRDQHYFEPYLTFDDRGYLYATSSATSSVEVFDREGTLVQSIVQVGNERLQEPVGIVAAPDGSMLITDKRRHAVFRYTPPLAPLPVEEDGEEIIDVEPAATPLGATPEASPAASPAGSPAASPT